MTRVGTKEAAEAVLRELPSVIGAFVREDINGHPREVHLLVRAGPNTRHLAYDVRDLLEERLGVPIDQRVISIAQLAPGRVPGPLLAERIGVAPPRGTQPGNDPASGDTADADSAEAALEPEPEGTPDVRLAFTGITTDVFDTRVRVTLTLTHEEKEYRVEAMGVDTVPARLHAAATATLQALDAACVGRARFEVEHVSQQHAFERDYVLVSVLASSPFLGRKPIPLVGAHPIEFDGESAAVLAALKAVNRTLSLVLRLADGNHPALPRRPRH